MKIPTGHLAELERLYVEEGLTLQELGDRYGVTREAVRIRLPRGLFAAKTAKRAERRRTQAFLSACERALVDNRVCRVCGSWILRRGTNIITCSSECSMAWLVVRSLDDPDEHRQMTARAYLTKPDVYKPSIIAWAKQMLGDDPPPRNRRFFVSGSKRSEIARRYRPELFKDDTA